jgi:hypothetical protein
VWHTLLRVPQHHHHHHHHQAFDIQYCSINSFLHCHLFTTLHSYYQERGACSCIPSLPFLKPELHFQWLLPQYQHHSITAAHFLMKLFAPTSFTHLYILQPSFSLPTS